jgi:hypothetical protein
MFRVDVTASRELQAMVRGLKFIEREWLSLWAREARRELEPEWRQQLEASRPNTLQRAVLVRTSRVSVSRKAIMLKAGATGRLSSGARAADIARATEFGQDPNLRTRYSRKNQGSGQHTVTRRTARPVGPKSPKGKVVWPALGRFVPRAAAVAVDLFYEVLRRVPGVK